MVRLLSLIVGGLVSVEASSLSLRDCARSVGLIVGGESNVMVHCPACYASPGLFGSDLRSGAF